MIQLNTLAPGILELRMARPPVNALNPALLQAIREGLDTAIADGAEGVVFSGAPGMFSAGLDVPYLLTLDRPNLEAAWQAFFGVCAALAHCPVPVAAAITGHSPAGGAVMALYCDYRVMAEGSFGIGLNEVQVGLVVPDPVQAALRRLVGAHRAERMLVAGAMLSPTQALEAGLVDELASPEQVVSAAQGFLSRHLALPRSAMLRTRELARAGLQATFADRSGSIDLGPFLDAWFESETQSVLHELVARLKSKR